MVFNAKNMTFKSKEKFGKGMIAGDFSLKSNIYVTAL